MICLDEGILREYLDGEMSQPQALSVASHLSQCLACQRSLELSRTRRERTMMLCAELAPVPGEVRTDGLAAERALARFKTRQLAPPQSLLNLVGGKQPTRYPQNINLILPESDGLPARLAASVRQFVIDFGHARPKATIEGFNFLLPDESLGARLKRELRVNYAEFKRDPQGFIRQLLTGESVNPRRRRLLQTGTAAAMAAYACVFTTFLLAGVLHFGAKDPAPAESLTIVKMLPPTSPVETTPENGPANVRTGKGGFTGGSQARLDRAGGGGGGGRQQPSPASAGHLPPMDMRPQILMPNPEPPKISNPSLVLTPTALGDPMLSKPLPGPTGLKDGADALPSSGPGRGAGIGDGNGTGVGSGDGAGLGPGEGFNTKGGRSNLGGGLSNGGTGTLYARGAMRPTITYREKAKYTEEARQHRIQGTVLLDVLFGTDSRIHDIRVLRQLPDGLTEQAIEAAQKIRFQPAVKNGVAVSVRMQLEFNFTVF